MWEDHCVDQSVKLVKQILWVCHCLSINYNVNNRAVASPIMAGNFCGYYKDDIQLICNGNRTEWSLIQYVIIRVINKIGRPRSRSPICLITSMITDQIGRHEVLLPINHNFNKICDIIGYFLNQNTRNSKFCFASSKKKKKPFKVRAWWRVLGSW